VHRSGFFRDIYYFAMIFSIVSVVPVSVFGFLVARYVKNRVNIRSIEKKTFIDKQDSEGVEFLKRK
jgi:hypothetical protein